MLCLQTNEPPLLGLRIGTPQAQRSALPCPRVLKSTMLASRAPRRVMLVITFSVQFLADEISEGTETTGLSG